MLSAAAVVGSTVLFLSYFGIGMSHEMRMGSCPDVEVMQGFDFKKFTGLWYVIQKTNAISTCLSLNFFEDNGVMKVRETGKPFGLSIPYVFEEVSQVGTLRAPSSKEPARMKVAYPISIAPYMEKDFWVVSTDYTTSAAMFACRPLVIANVHAGIILSREPTLDGETVKELRDRFNSFGLNLNKMADVDQVNCRRNTTLKLDSDHHDEMHGGGGNDPVVVGSKPANNETEFIFTLKKKDQKPPSDSDNEIGNGRQRRNF